MARFKRADPGQAFIHETQTAATHPGTAVLTSAGATAGTGITTSDTTDRRHRRVRATRLRCAGGVAAGCHRHNHLRRPAPLAGAGAVTAGGVLILAGAAALTGAGAVTATGQLGSVTVTGAAALVAAGTLTAVPRFPAGPAQYSINVTSRRPPQARACDMERCDRPGGYQGHADTFRTLTG